MKPAERLVEEHMPLALSVAKTAVRRYRLPLDEALDHAYFGLVKAARRADPDRAFAPYAQKFMTFAILQGTRDWHGTRQNGGTMPSFVPWDDACMSDHVPSPHEDLEHKELWEAVDRLPERERIAIRLNYQWGISQEKIGNLFGVSQMQACRYIKRGQETLAEALAA